MTDARYDLDRAPVTIEASRGKIGLLLVGCLAFVAAGALMSGDPANRTVGLLSVGFFGLCGLIGLAQFALGSRLTIGPDGVTLSQPWRRHHWRWTEACAFRAAPYGVLFDRADAPAPLAVFEHAGPAQGALPGNWTISNSELAELLNRARERWA